MTPKELAEQIARVAEDIQAVDIVLLDLIRLTSFTSYFVICSGKSDTQVRAIADAVQKRLKENGHMPLGVEGYQPGEWVLVDFGDVVAHIFHQEVRNYYNLEKLWADAPRFEFKEAANV